MALSICCLSIFVVCFKKNWYIPLKEEAVRLQHQYNNNCNIIRRHGSDVYLGMSPVQNGGSYLMYYCASAKLAKRQ